MQLRVDVREVNKQAWNQVMIHLCEGKLAAAPVFKSLQSTYYCIMKPSALRI